MDIINSENIKFFIWAGAILLMLPAIFFFFKWRYKNYLKDFLKLETNQEIDVDSFKYLWWDYAKDKNSVYHEWDKMSKEVDVDSFKYLWWDYAKDRNNVYNYWKRMSNKINIKSFEYLWWDYTKDEDNIYYMWKKIKQSKLWFKHLGWNYIKYKNKIYYDYHW